jgi:hypothetical protein
MTVNDLLWYFLLVILTLYSLYGLSKVYEWNRRPVMFFGKYAWTAGPGLIWIPPFIFQTLNDISVQSVVTSRQIENARTKDNIPVSMEITITARTDPNRVKDFVLQVEDGRAAIDLRAEAAAVEVIGSSDWEHIQKERPKFSDEVYDALKAKVGNWGINIERIEIINIKITDSTIAEAMAKVAIAQAAIQTETILSKGIDAAAVVYGVDKWELRKLMTTDRLATGGSMVMVDPSAIGTFAAAQAAKILPKR